MKSPFAMGEEFHGGGFTAFFVGVAEGQKGRIFGEFPAHVGGRAEQQEKRALRPLTPTPRIPSTIRCHFVRVCCLLGKVQLAFQHQHQGRIPLSKAFETVVSQRQKELAERDKRILSGKIHGAASATEAAGGAGAPNTGNERKTKLGLRDKSIMQKVAKRFSEARQTG